MATLAMASPPGPSTGTPMPVAPAFVSSTEKAQPRRRIVARSRRRAAALVIVPGPRRGRPPAITRSIASGGMCASSALADAPA